MKKELKTKKFRYLEKDEIKRPLHYLHEFYRHEVKFESWRMEVELLLLSGLDGRLKRIGFEYGLIGQRLIKQIEAAYALYIQANIKDKVRFRSNVQTMPEMYAVLGQEHIYQPAEALLLFFEYHSLKDWIQEIEWVVGYASLGLKKYLHGPNDDSLLIYSRTMALVDSLYQIYLSDGMEVDLLENSLKRKNGN